MTNMRWCKKTGPGGGGGRNRYLFLSTETLLADCPFFLDESDWERESFSVWSLSFATFFCRSLCFFVSLSFDLSLSLRFSLAFSSYLHWLSLLYTLLPRPDRPSLPLLTRSSSPLAWARGERELELDRDAERDRDLLLRRFLLPLFLKK